jgi:dGTPase
MTDVYMNNHSSEEIVRDFISGMTDQYFIQQSPEEMRPAFQSL